MIDAQVPYVSRGTRSSAPFDERLQIVKRLLRPPRQAMADRRASGLADLSCAAAVATRFGDNLRALVGRVRFRCKAMKFPICPGQGCNMRLSTSAA
jgi:hypothetical protein